MFNHVVTHEHEGAKLETCGVAVSQEGVFFSVLHTISVLKSEVKPGGVVVKLQVAQLLYHSYG